MLSSIRSSHACRGATTLRPIASRQGLVPTAITVRFFSDPEGPKTKQLKVKKKEKRGAKKKDGGRDRLTELMIKAIDAPRPPKPPASEEEMERRHHIGRNYVIGKFEQHNETEHDLACKLRMKKQAIRMLPKDSMWREEALKEDDEAPPLWRHIAVDTPPIPGFDPTQFIEKEED